MTLSKTNLPFDEIRALISQLSENSDDVYWLSSPDFSSIAFISKAFETIWGRSPQELYQSPERWPSFLHPEEPTFQHPLLTMHKCLANQGTNPRYEKTYRIVRPNGEVRCILDRGFPLFDTAGNSHCFIGIASDVTNEKKAEIALQKATEKVQAAHELKLQFIENMQHDLRTPAHGIVSGLSNLLNNNEPANNANIKTIYHAAKELYTLCLEVTDLNKVNLQEINICNKKFSLAALINSVINLNTAFAKQKNIVLRATIHEETPDILEGDDYRLKRILINLVGNALKFTEEGSIHVSVKHLASEDGVVLLRFQISDTGPGIPKEPLRFLQEEFSVGCVSNQTTERKLGLGLRLVKRFVNDLGGNIDIESSPQGSDFYITLLFKKPSAQHEILANLNSYAPDATVHPAPPKPVGSEKSVNILLIEDEPLARAGAISLLEQAGHNVAVADTIRNAKQQLEQEKFDVVLSDLELPDGQGFSIAQYLTQHSTSLNYQTAIFALTAHDSFNKEQQARQAGFSGLMTKPLTAQTFATLVNNHLSKPTEAGKEGKVIDFSIAARYNLTRQQAWGMLDTFCSALPQEINALRGIVASENISQLTQMLHRLKGGICYLGVPSLLKAIETLHEQVKAKNDLRGLEDVYQEAHRLLSLHQELKSQGADRPSAGELS